VRGIWSLLQTWWSGFSIDWCATAIPHREARVCGGPWRSETWIRVLRRAASTTGGSGLIHGYIAIARNLAIDDLRKKRKRWQQYPCQIDRDATLLLPSSDPSPFEAAARSEDAMRLPAALQILPPLYREALLLRFQEDLSLAEMAQVLGAPTTTVTSRIYRGLAALRSAFEEGDRMEGDKRFRELIDSLS